MKTKSKSPQAVFEQAEASLHEVYDLIKTDKKLLTQKKNFYKVVHDIFLLKEERTIEDIFDEKVGAMTTAMAKFDFSQRIPLSDVTNDIPEFDYIASCLNTINEKYERIAFPVSLIDALQNAPKGASIIITDANEKIRYSNKIAVELTGIMPEILMKKSIGSVLKDYKTTIKEKLKEKGQLQDYPAHAVVFDITKGKSTFASIFLDVTVGVNRLGDIEGIVYVLKQESANADEFKIKSMAHDLISPSTSMYTILDLMFDKYEEFGELMESIRACNNNTLQKARTIMRTDKGKSAMVEGIYLQDVINKTINQLHFLEGRDQVDISIKVDSIEAFFNNRRFIESIIQNLIVNAIKYRKPNERTNINVTVTDISNGIQLIVQDTGIGMKEEEKKKLFDRGYQADQNAEGYGFGLYSISKYLHEINGDIKVESKLNIGTRFILDIPSMNSVK